MWRVRKTQQQRRETMSKKLEGKIAVITGGTERIGSDMSASRAEIKH